MNNVMEAPETAHTVRAAVNEKQLLSTLKHMFTSSLTALGELMQNARRAGATQVDFHFDVKKHTLCIADDGQGISDFGVLVHLCESNWDEQTTLTDHPFGMGAFSLLYAAAEVTYLSQGKALTVTLDDVVNKRPLAVRSDSRAPQKGTRIELTGLTPSLLTRCGHTPAEQWMMVHGDLLEWDLCRKIARNALGFPIAVTLNGVACPRPHAQDALAGEMSPIGFISLSGVHRECGNRPAGIPGVHAPHLYLQGLPIVGMGRRDYIVDRQHVVHLDSQVFAARMPDREQLYDAQIARNRIATAMTSMVQRFLAAQKDALDGSGFVARHWTDCRVFRMQHLLNDIPYIPTCELQSVERISACTDEAYGHNPTGENLVARDDILTGKVKIWREAPDTADENAAASLVLKVMKKQGILALRFPDLDKQHWVFGCTPSANDLRFEVLPVNAGATREMGSHGNYNVRAQLADAVLVRITSSVDSALRVDVRFEDDWLMCPAEHLQQELSLGHGPEDQEGVICYIAGAATGGWDHPLDALTSFQDENDTYRDEWRDDAIARWDSQIAAMAGSTLARVLEPALWHLPIEPIEAHKDQLAVVYVAPRPSGALSLAIADPQRAGFWDEVATAFAKLESSAPLAHRLRQAFDAAVKPVATPGNTSSQQ